MNEEEYQRLPKFPEIDYVIDNGDEEISANSYGQYIGAKLVLPDKRGG